MFLGGPSILAWLVLAIGAAMAVGSIGALVRPPEQTREGDLDRAPTSRSIAMAVIGVIAALWAVASLASGDASDDDSAGADVAVEVAVTDDGGQTRWSRRPRDWNVSNGSL